jgi:hypothetical protein
MPGYIDASSMCPCRPSRLDRSLGDQHPMGNLHQSIPYVPSPWFARSRRASRNFPEHASVFQKFSVYQELDAAIAR